MVDLDAEVITSSRRYLSTYSNCTGFGTASCFDDPRVSLFTMDFFKWFSDNIGDDICQTRMQKKDLLFDVIILDLLDTEELPEGQAWAEYLYSELFFERIACATNDHGVVVSNYGEAPETPFEPLLPSVHYMNEAGDDTRIGMYAKKIEQLRSFSAQFHHFRVYDSFVPAFRASWAFAMGIVPRVSEDIEEKTKIGISFFDGTPVQVDYKLENGLLPLVGMEHYNGLMQQAYQQPTGDWSGAYCDVAELFENKVPLVTYRPTNMVLAHIKGQCLLSKRFVPDETVLWKVETSADNKKSVVALSDLAKDTILGVWDEVMPGADKIVDTMERSCSGPNTERLVEAEPHLTDTMWNPKLNRMQSQVAHGVVLTTNVKAGTKLTIKGDKC